MTHPCSMNDRIKGHPCFGGDHRKNGRMHLPVAPRCNISCGYCSRRHDCANESRPGVTSRLLTPAEAIERVRLVMTDPVTAPLIKVIGIAGPGDPLANDETFTTFEMVRREFPELMLCLSTNGLLLPDTLDRLHDLGLHSLTVTINAINPTVGARIYQHVRYHGRESTGVEGASLLAANQLAGVQRAAERGITVKVNTVLIPGINDGEIPLIAETVSKVGAFVMNIMPLIPQGSFSHLTPPSPEYLRTVRSINERTIKQFSHCRQCRADAIGLIGSDLSQTTGDPSCII